MIDDFFILEDDLEIVELLKLSFDYLNAHFAKDGKEFEQYLNEGRSARVYFLDDTVPDADGTINYHFIKHCSKLLELRPDATVFYIGNGPDIREYQFCGKHGVELIPKKDIAKKMSEILTQK